MPPEALSPIRNAGGASARIPDTWRLPLAQLALVWLAIVVATASDWAAMAHQWWNISTYNHVLLIPPIIAWLIWQRRGELFKITPNAFWPGLVILALALFVWLLGAVSGFDLVRQAGTVGAMQAAVLAILGPRVVAAILFPLAYAVFLVPFGDEIVPALQMITAKMVIAMTHWSGIPAQIDGVFIDTPVGLFEVAEACSGVKFLIAMIALGTLVANSCFERWGRRLVFMGAALALPIVANGVRAWGTIYIAQSQGIEFAAGFDHVFYGWVFFAIIIAVLLTGSWRWFDRDPEDSGISAKVIEGSSLLGKLSSFTVRPMIAALIGIGLVAGFSIWAAATERVTARLPKTITLAAVPGWKIDDTASAIPWHPLAGGADHRIQTRFRNMKTGAVVDVVFAAYSAQREGSEAGATGEGALPPDTDWRWLRHGAQTDDANGEYLLALGTTKRLATTTYRRGDLTTGTLTKLKLAVMRGRLVMDRKPVTMLIVSAEQTGDRDAETAVARFRSAIAPVGEWMDRSAGLR